MKDAAVAAIEYAINPTTDEGLAFLKCWLHGEFDAIRNEWPDAPKSVFVGAETVDQHSESVKNKLFKMMIEHGMREGDVVGQKALLNFCRNTLSNQFENDALPRVLTELVELQFIEPNAEKIILTAKGYQHLSQI
jgi:hypothetical protein